jgi:adenine C2-methylase RlmN of 23S rRNA A2503 and tRNA A37
MTSLAWVAARPRNPNPPSIPRRIRRRSPARSSARSTRQILEEVLHLRNLLPPDETITHIVVMGMGESLANLVKALDRICSPVEGLGSRRRRVTISTVGLPEKIRKRAAMGR